MATANTVGSYKGAATTRPNGQIRSEIVLNLWASTIPAIFLLHCLKDVDFNEPVQKYPE
jgi:hypothetical protein